MRLILCLLLASSFSYAADGSTAASSKAQPAFVQSLSTGVYRPATVIVEGLRAKVQFNQGGQMVLALDSAATSESEEIVGVDKDDNYWAVYIDKAAAQEQPSAASLDISTPGVSAAAEILSCRYFLQIG